MHRDVKPEKPDAMFVAEARFTDSFDAMPWRDDFERSDARADIDRNPFRDDPMLR